MRLQTLVLLALIFLILICGASSQPLFQNFIEKIANNEVESARKKKKSSSGGKYLVTLLFVSLLVKSIVFPLAFKAMAVMSSVAVALSTMSLIVSSLVGYAKLALGSSKSPVKVVKVPYNSWAKDDHLGKNNYYNGENYDLQAPPQ